MNKIGPDGGLDRRQVKDCISIKGNGKIPIKTDDVAKELCVDNPCWLEIRNAFPDDFCSLFFEFDHKAYSEGGKDGWGIVRTIRDRGLSGIITEHPLNSWDKLSSWNPPNPHLQVKDRRLRRQNWGEWIEVSKEKLSESMQYRLGYIHCGLFLQPTLLRGFENLMMDLFHEKRKVLRLVDMIVEYNLGLINEWEQVGVDGIFLLDEMASQDGPFINPDLWREIFYHPYKLLVNEIHRKNMQVFYHSCGNATKMIADLIDIGFDLLDTLKATTTDHKKVSRDYKGMVAFLGGPSNKLFQNGTEREIIEASRQLADNFMTDKGGFVGASPCTIYPQTPVENIKAMYKTWKEDV